MKIKDFIALALQHCPDDELRVKLQINQCVETVDIGGLVRVNSASSDNGRPHVAIEVSAVVKITEVEILGE